MDLKNKPEDLTRQNPYGKVPVLVDGDGVIYESAIIDEYLEEKFPQVRLMPTDLLLRAKARIWIDYFSTRLHAAAADITHEREPEKAQQRLKQYLTDSRSGNGRQKISGRRPILAGGRDALFRFTPGASATKSPSMRIIRTCGDGPKT